MFQPWIKKKSLKKPSRSGKLVLEGERPSMIALLSMSAILVGVGVFVIQKSLADQASPVNAVTPAATPSNSVTPSPSPQPVGR
jgi:hypothetical protein